MGRETSRTQRLAVILGVNVALALGQVVAGLVAHSTGLLSDAGHNITDVAGITMSLVAVRFALRPRSPAHSFGYHRGTILAALANAAIIAAVTVAIVAVAVDAAPAPPARRGRPDGGRGPRGLRRQRRRRPGRPGTGPGPEHEERGPPHDGRRRRLAGGGRRRGPDPGRLPSAVGRPGGLAGRGHPHHHRGLPDAAVQSRTSCSSRPRPTSTWPP